MFDFVDCHSKIISCVYIFFKNVITFNNNFSHIFMLQEMSSCLKWWMLFCNETLHFVSLLIENTDWGLDKATDRRPNQQLGMSQVTV